MSNSTCVECGKTRWNTVHLDWQSRLDFHFYRSGRSSDPVEARHEIRHDDDKPCRACGRPATYPRAGS